MADAGDNTIREAVGVLTSDKALEAAIDDLGSAGFDRLELSLLATAETVDAKLGHRYRSVAELEDDSSVPRAAYVSKEAVGDAEGAIFGGLVYVGAVAAGGAVVASGGTLGAAITAAALAGGGGGVIGAFLARLIGRHHAEHLAEQLERGGLLLWVRTRDAAHESRAKAILEKHGARDVHVHDLPVS